MATCKKCKATVDKFSKNARGCLVGKCPECKHWGNLDGNDSDGDNGSKKAAGTVQEKKVKSKSTKKTGGRPKPKQTPPSPDRNERSTTDPIEVAVSAVGNFFRSLLS